MKPFYYGAAYYPELWDDTVIRQDIEEMKSLGINLVRMGEFAWSKMEPEPGRFSFSFFSELITRLADEGIFTIFCTPTAAPPIWMSYGHPERMYTDAAGPVVHGGRQHVCTNNPYFRERCALVVQELAKAVGRLHGLVGWQIDNELKCNVAECYCENCRQQWHAWLARRYGTIERLNEAWGTGVWSQTYQSFEQVPPPIRATTDHNPSLATMYRQFSRDKATEFLHMQAAILREYSSAPITHNSAVYFQVDNAQLASELDFVCLDDYSSAKDFRQYIFQLDYYRSLKPGIPFMVMETSPSHGGHLRNVPAPHPQGYVRAEALAAYALGADGFSHWLFRQHASGQEIPHGSILSTWGGRTEGWRQVKAATEAKTALESMLAGSRPAPAKIALHYVDMARQMLLTEPADGVEYLTGVRRFYDLLVDAGLMRDVIAESAGLEGYALLLTPYLPAFPEGLLARILRFVKHGGVWMAGPMTGYRTPEHTVPTDAAFGALEAVAGVRVNRLEPVLPQRVKIQFFGTEAYASGLSAFMEPLGGQAAGLYISDDDRGQAFLTEHAYGSGKILLLGTLPDGKNGRAMLERVIAYACRLAGAASVFRADKGVVAAQRVYNDGRIRNIAINMSGRVAHVETGGSWHTVAPYDAAVLPGDI